MPFPTQVGRYQIKSRIGGGGMGTLYLARDTNPTTDRLVALKLLNANLEHGDLRARFSREARSLSALSHPNIVISHDSGEFQGAPFIVMEYVRGESLAEKIRRKAPMSLGQKIRLMTELCDGLAHAHGAGIIHRDIKPANLMVDQHGRLKILDFGIAREGDSRQAQGGLTRLHTSIGTPGYMSPEQIEGVAIDHRADLFSAGTVCYELLAYREAFTGGTTRQIEKRVMHDDPPPLMSVVPGLDPRIAEIIALALKKDVSERAQSAGELLDAFQGVLATLPADVQPTHVTPLPPVEASAGGESRRRRAAEMAHQRALASKAEGALDFARRSALEALAEDAEHGPARMLLREFGGEADAAQMIEPTQLAWSQEDTLSGDRTVVNASGSTPRRPAVPLPWRPDQRPWVRFAPLAGAAAVALVLVGLAVAFRDRWLPADDAPLSRVVVAEPEARPVEESPGLNSGNPVRTTLIATLQDAQGVPVNEAEVALSPGNIAAPGNGFGQYVFESIAPGPYALTVRHASFRERTVTLEVAPGGVQQSIVLDRVTRMAELPLRDPKRPAPEDYRRPPPPPFDPLPRPLDPQPRLPVDAAPRDTRRVDEPSRQPPDNPGPGGTPSGSARSSVLAQDALERAVRAINDDGDLDRAERLLAEARRFDPESKDVARELERLRDMRAVELRQFVRDHVLRAQRLFREAGDLDGALREVDRALSRLPSDPQAVGLREDILRVQAIGTKKPPPAVVGPGVGGDAWMFDESEHR